MVFWVIDTIDILSLIFKNQFPDKKVKHMPSKLVEIS